MTSQFCISKNPRLLFGRGTVARIVNSASVRVLRRLARWSHRRLPDANPRRWSNEELRMLAPLYSGAVINVSAGDDGDKSGRVYRDYFLNCSSYCKSNYQRADEAAGDGLRLDLAEDLSGHPELTQRFDVVFTHTVLEHVYEIHRAVENLCLISRDTVITVVPALQAYHHEEHVYKDFWRFTPFTLIRLFGNHGFKTVYLNWNRAAVGNVYLLHVASKHPQKWEGKLSIPAHVVSDTLGPGAGYQEMLFGELSQNSRISSIGEEVGSVEACRAA